MKRILLVVVLTLALVSVMAGGASAQGTVHYVSPGETLTSIASHYGVSVQALMQYNGIYNPNVVYAGQPLRIPPTARASCARSHLVTPGETLSSIAVHYGVTVRDLLAFNRLSNPDLVPVGHTLCLPYAAPSAVIVPPPAAPVTSIAPVQSAAYGPSPYYYTVSSGDTLFSVASYHGVDHHTIVQANYLHNADVIVPGQRLVIPGYQPYQKSVIDAPPSLPPAAPPGVNAEPRDSLVTADPPPPPPKNDVIILEPPPPAPAYEPQPRTPLLPEASHPIEVVVNGEAGWVGQAFESHPDPNDITTLIVALRDEDIGDLPLPTVRIRSGDYEVKGHFERLPEFGYDKLRFAFKYIPPGDFDVWLEDANRDSEKVLVDVQPGQRVEVEFRAGIVFGSPAFASPDGFVLSEYDNSSIPGERRGGWSTLFVQAPASGLNIVIESEGGGFQAKCLTGSKGPGACEFGGLQAGFYTFKIDGTDLSIKTYLDGAAQASFTIGRQSVPASERDKVGPVNYSD